MDFPSPAQGWIALNYAGLSEEQKAIAKAKMQGKLDLPTVTAALRSCFPQLRVSSAKARRPVNTTLLAEDTAVDDSMPDVDGFGDVETFLADHGNTMEDLVDPVPFLQEDEAAEALAITWRERRQEITRLQQARRFGAVGQAKKSFRVEIEELKRRTKCRRCGKVGHWARECRSPPTKGKGQDGSAASSTSGPSSSTDANLVQDYVEEQTAGVYYTDNSGNLAFVGNAECHQGSHLPLEQLAAGLVSSPGYGVVD